MAFERSGPRGRLVAATPSRRRGCWGCWRSGICAAVGGAGGGAGRVRVCRGVPAGHLRGLRGDLGRRLRAVVRGGVADHWRRVGEQVAVAEDQAARTMKARRVSWWLGQGLLRLLALGLSVGDQVGESARRACSDRVRDDALDGIGLRCGLLLWLNFACRATKRKIKVALFLCAGILLPHEFDQWNRTQCGGARFTSSL